MGDGFTGEKAPNSCLCLKCPSSSQISPEHLSSSVFYSFQPFFFYDDLKYLSKWVCSLSFTSLPLFSPHRTHTGQKLRRHPISSLPQPVMTQSPVPPSMPMSPQNGTPHPPEKAGTLKHVCYTSLWLVSNLV